MKVKLVAITRYLEGEGCEGLLEHAGRVCYRSKSPGTPVATAQFIRRRINEGHESIIEHVSATFEIVGISRACSHQLVRHRLASYSQESQRYVDMSNPRWVMPPSVAASPEAVAVWEECIDKIVESYRRLRALGVAKEDARFLLPNATATRLVMTANLREWLHIFRLRISPHAQWEIREVCVRMLEAIYPHAPNVFGTLRQQLYEQHPHFFRLER